MADTAVHVVLVPGFWLGGWAWDDVVGPLRDAGLVPHPVTLPGMTDDAPDRATVTREDQVEAVRALAAGLDGPVVLVGHSGGGALVGEVVDRDPGRYARVVYLDSGPLVDGAALNPPLPPGVTDIPLPAWEELEAQGSSLAGLDDGALTRFRERAVPQPGLVATGVARMADPGRFAVPVTAVCTSISAEQLMALASHDAPFHTELLDYPDLTFVDLPTGHWAMFSRPAELAAALVQACRD
ncbi:alpha/beta fold hydrolase [Cellulomonas alba]|uniref:Alpha/beta hydrolase n=1 Tax=Cellulomonas alba TaxID=3053467 RepID=A0ABT7SFD8_9CELL|nr:alpha/beta hydrolase [Cellulomonas alba]MDM7854892.1 alpha/beta hydrolase [Cellulomonas alba]